MQPGAVPGHQGRTGAPVLVRAGGLSVHLGVQRRGISYLLQIQTELVNGHVSCMVTDMPSWKKLKQFPYFAWGYAKCCPNP